MVAISLWFRDRRSNGDGASEGNFADDMLNKAAEIVFSGK
jgi:hypothetical protein